VNTVAGEQFTLSYLLTIPYDGLNPQRPQYDAGNRIDPPVSVPRALANAWSVYNRTYDYATYASQRPAATAAALPPELPPEDLAPSSE
jgi:hypothetical protein